MELKTPLYDCHVSSGGKIVPFAGYLMPIQYTGIIEEHMAVRRDAGLFDVSHMGEIILSGSEALRNLNYLFTNDFTNMTDGQVRYTVMCNENGGIVDDMIIYRIHKDYYMIVVNAANHYKDVEFIQKHITGCVEMKDISDQTAQIALQGPKSRDILLALTSEQNIPNRYYTFTPDVDISGVTCLVSQTGYTGEHGYELYCSPEEVEKLWQDLIYVGNEYGLIACGLGARDTLRLEASMPLYGHEMNEDISPLETGLKFAVKMKKARFIGKEAIEARGKPAVTRVGLRITGKGIARENNTVIFEGREIGKTTSGTHCPYLGGSYAMALIETDYSAKGTEVQVEVRGRKINAEIISLPFYKADILS